MKSRSFLLFAVLSVFSCDRNGLTVCLSDYLDGSQDDAMPAIREALRECSRTPGSTLVLPGDTLRIKPDYAFERFLRISNNDPGAKRIAFDLEGVDGLTIEGNGTTLLFSGYISPFYILDSWDITVKDLTIDFERPFVSEGTITASGDGWVDLSFAEEYGASLRSGLLVFRDRGRTRYPYGNLLEFDTQKKEVAYHVHDYWISDGAIPSSQNSDGTYRISLPGLVGTVGNTLVFGAAARLNPAFTLDGCDGFTLEDVHLYNCCGMGVIAQRSSDLELDRVQVAPSPGSERVISISADATHFINCKGFIHMIDCDFRNQKDDATNIHGWYASAREKVSDNELLVWYNYGMDFVLPGMELEFVDHNTMMTYDTLRVMSVKKLNDEYSVLTFDRNLPEYLEVKDALADISCNPDVLISGCYIGNNRARGFLIGSKGHVVIENNTFHTPGSAILFEGDGNYWYEQSGVKDVTIRGNLFENCMYGSRTWGNAVISVGSGIPDKEHSRYHGGIVVEDNTFRGFDSRIVNIYSVDGFTFRGNRIETTGDYPPFGDPADALISEYCDNVKFEK